MSDEHAPRYTFGPFVLDPAERRLLRDGEPVDLPPKAFDTLVVLVENGGRLVSKGDLLDRVWPDAVVEENYVSVNVSKLRAALGETAQDWTYIETVPRSGYRFAPVVETLAAGEVTRTRRTRRRLVLVEEWRGRRPGRRGSVLLGLTGVALVSATVLAWEPPRSAAGAPTAPGVITPARPVGPPPPLPERALARAAYGRGRALWWGRRGLERALAQFRLALHYDSTFAPGYVGLAGVHAFGYGTDTEVRPLLERALALDPHLGTAYATRGFVRMMQDWDWAGAEADLTRALALDPADVSALQWTATLRMVQRRPGEADRLLRRALAVAPPEALPSLHADRAQALYYTGAYDEAVAAGRHARRLDPGFPMGYTYEESALILSGRPQEAAEVILGHGPGHERTPEAAERLRRAAGAGAEPLLRHLMTRYDPAETLTHPYALARLHAAVGEAEPALEHLARAVAVREFLVPFCNADPVFEGLRPDPRFQALMREVGLAPADGVAPPHTAPSRSLELAL